MCMFFHSPVGVIVTRVGKYVQRHLHFKETAAATGYAPLHSIEKEHYKFYENSNMKTFLEEKLK